MTQALSPPLAEGSSFKSVPVLVRLNSYPESLRVAVYLYSTCEWLLHQPPPHNGCTVSEWWPLPALDSGIPSDVQGETVK